MRYALMSDKQKVVNLHNKQDASELVTFAAVT